MVLLDNNMVAHVGDFGLAIFLFEESNGSPQQSTMSSVLMGYPSRYVFHSLLNLTPFCLSQRKVNKKNG